MTIGNGSLSPSQLCKYHYSGYCKSKSECPNQHLELTCLQGPSCKDNYCRKVKRHPNFCRHYLASGFCKLEKECSYTHKSFVTEISDLKLQLDDLKNWIQLNMKQNTSKPKSQVQGPEYPCPSCPKICKSPSGLKRHTQTRHLEVPKIEDPSPKSKEQVQKESNEQSQITVGPGPELDNSPSIPPEDSEFECSLDNPSNWSKKRKKKELALIIEQKLKSYYSKQNDEEEERNVNPHKKYIFDLTTGKKYIYDNEERAIFRFTSGGGLGQTVFYNEFSGDIPSSQLGEITMDSNNRIQYSNVQQIKSFEEEHEDQEDDHGIQNELDADQQYDHQDPVDPGHQEDEDGCKEDSDNSSQHSDEDTSSQHTDNDDVEGEQQGPGHEDQGEDYHLHDGQGDQDPHQGADHDFDDDSQDQQQDVQWGPDGQLSQEPDNTDQQRSLESAYSQDNSDDDDDKYSASDSDDILHEIENYFSTKR